MNLKEFNNILSIDFYKNKDKEKLKKVVKQYPYLFPESLFNRFKNNYFILKQFLPDINEITEHSCFKEDPLNEKRYTKLPGLIHRFPEKVLLILTYKCFFNCRFCFRKNLTYKNLNVNFNEILNYLKNNKKIKEVILSGGDPLKIPYEKLLFLLDSIYNISHIKFVRIHTRAVVLLPHLLNEKIINYFRKLQHLILVFHINHPDEIQKDFINLVYKLNKSNIILLNQNVLLKGINDKFETLYKLYYKLGKLKIIPYYCHQLDKAKGTTHFYVPIKKGKFIFYKLKKYLPGYLVPKYVIDLSSKKGKITIV